MDEAMDFQMEYQAKTDVQSPESHSLHALASSPQSPAFSEQEVGEDVLAFLHDGKRSPSPTPEPTWNNFNLDLVNAMSPASVATVISAGALVMDLPEFLQTIGDRQSLRKAEIRSVEQYYVWTGTVYHRFLILELVRTGRKAIWVRLDRHRGGGLIELATGTALAHDEALLRADKGTLIRGAVQENKQTFATTPTLGNLKFLLEAITEEMKFYTVWPENCYFFCSLIQQHLGEMNDGTFVLGELYRPAMAQDVRDKVSERVRSICQRPVKSSLQLLFQNLDPWRTWPYAQEFLKISSELDHPHPHSSTRTKAAKQLCQRVVNVNDFLCQTYDRNFALSVHRTVHQYLNGLPDWGQLKIATVPNDLRLYYYAFLHSYSLLLPEPVHPATLSGTAEQDTGIRGELFVEFPSALENYKASLGQAPFYHGGAQHDLESAGFQGLFSSAAIESWIHISSFLELNRTAPGQAADINEACAVYGLLVDLQRRLFRSHARQHRKLLCHSLHQYGMHLCEAGRLEEAHAASIEAVNLVRVLYPEGHDEQKPRSATHADEGCSVIAENVQLMRMLCVMDAGRYHRDFSSSLHQHSICLGKARRHSEACDVRAEDVALKRMLHSSDPEAQNSQLLESLNHYIKCLNSAERYDEADDVSLEVNRMLYAKDPDGHQSEFALFLQRHTVYLIDAGRSSEACIVSAEEVALRRVLYASDPDQHRWGLAWSLHHYGLALRDSERFGEACDAGAEDVALQRVLYASDPDQHRRGLTSSLYHYGLALRDAGRFGEACDAGAENVEGNRALYATNADLYQWRLSNSLEQYGRSLREAGRLSEAYDASAEGIKLMRALYTTDADEHRWDLARSLHEYGVTLRDSGRFSEACDAGAEDVELTRALYTTSPDEYRWDLSASLHEYSRSLSKAGRISEACIVAFEAVALIRAASAGDMNEHRDDAIEIMGQYAAYLHNTGRFKEANEIHKETAALDATAVSKG